MLRPLSPPTTDETVAYADLERTHADHRDIDTVSDDGFPIEDDLSGRSLSQYQVGRILGRGSMARVYQADHLGLGRTCALKVMNPALVAKKPQVVDHFWAEARAVAHLVHPHVVTVHNLGSDRGYHFIEMEHVPGGRTLKEALIHEGPLPPVEATLLVRQIARGLGAAHQAGLVHRDVKPANVLLSADGTAKLADFGLVLKPADRAGTWPLAGTPSFMAPELFRGAEANSRTDFYAVGVTYYSLLTGLVPFSATRLERLIHLHVTAPPPDLRQHLSDAPEALVRTLDRLLAKDPAERPGSAEELIEELSKTLAELRNTVALVEEVFEGLAQCFEPHGQDGFRLVVPIGEGRLQEVFVETVSNHAGDRLLIVYSVCAPALPEHHEFALRLNAELTHASLSVRSVNDQPMFVMSRAFLRHRMDAADVRAAVVEIARRGDWVEQQLTSHDIF